jgi:NAD(P)-dependent dehydrogenase (short-subunit alcohol dehydrogenase family)
VCDDGDRVDGKTLEETLCVKRKKNGIKCETNKSQLSSSHAYFHRVDVTAVTARCANDPAIGSKHVKVSTHRCDVSSREQCVAFAKEVLNAHDNCVHILFNNAGVYANGRQLYQDKGRGQPPEEVVAMEAGWDRCFNIDFLGVVYMTR